MRVPDRRIATVALLGLLGVLAGCNKSSGTAFDGGGIVTILGDGGGATGHHDAGTERDAGVIVVVDAGPTPLSISSLSPNRGPTAGGSIVTLSGGGFFSGLVSSDFTAAAQSTAVTFGGNPVLTVLVLSDGALQVTSPAGAAGPADVTVTNPNGSTTCSGCFAFQAPIEIDEVTPPNGPLSGGTPLSVLGLGFDSNTVLVIGGQGALQTTLVSATQLSAVSPASAAAGPVPVRAFNPNGSASLFNAFTYFATPSVFGLAPAFGPIAGGTSVTLTGAGFLGESLSVTIGGASATQVAVVNDTTVTFATPPGAVGAATVVVSDADGSATLAAGFVYFDPSVSSFGLWGVVPAAGPVSGGSPVSLVGSGFTSDFGVSFGDAGPVTAVVASANLATATTSASGDPTGSTVDVIADGGAFAATLPAAFTYLPARTLTAVLPASGPSAGGTPIQVTGQGFLPGDQLLVGPLAATQVAIVDSTSLTATTPVGSAGPATVTLVAADGGNRATLAAGFTYLDPFSLVQVNPASGSQAGGTYVELLGTGFGLGDTAFFGGLPASDLQLLDGYTLACLTPPGPIGPADVTALAPGDAGASTLAGGYSYFDPTNGSGGQNGGPLDGTLNVTVLSNSPYSYGAAIEGATVRLGLDPQTPFQGSTDVHGQITFSDPTLVKPQTVTASFDGAATTVDDVTQQDLTLFIDVQVGSGGGGASPCPCSQNGGPPDCPDNCGLPFCNVVGICVQCLSDSDCQNPSNPGYSPSTPHCYPPVVGGACVHCTADSDCADDPNGNLACDDERGTQSTFTCVQCTQSSFCPTGDYCDTQTVTCLPSDLVEGNVYGFKLPPNVTVPEGCDVEAHVGILQPAVYYYEPFGPAPSEYVVVAEGGGFGFEIDASSLNLALYAKFGIACGATNFTPYLLGVVRNVAVDPQNPAMGVTILLDTHLDQVAPITLQNTLAPPPQVFFLGDGGLQGSGNPVIYDTFAYLDLGQTGVVPLNDVQTTAATASLTGLPPLQGNGILFLTQAFQNPPASVMDGMFSDPDQRSPTSDFFRSVDGDFTAGVPMGPLLPFVVPVQPASGGTLNGTFQWSFGGSTPAVGPPDLTQIQLAYVQIEQGQEISETELWDIIVPGTETEVQIPDDLLQQVLSAVPSDPLAQTFVFWQINTANAPRFDYAFFSYADLSENAWTGFQTTNVLANP